MLHFLLISLLSFYFYRYNSIKAFLDTKFLETINDRIKIQKLKNYKYNFYNLLKLNLIIISFQTKLKQKINKNFNNLAN